MDTLIQVDHFAFGGSCCSSILSAAICVDRRGLLTEQITSP